jgi:hypothetical protein
MRQRKIDVDTDVDCYVIATLISDVIGLVGYKFDLRNQLIAYLKPPTGCLTG